MEKKVFLCESLIWAMMILLGQIHGYKGCIVKEREALLVLKTYVDAQTTWTNDTKSDCCRWENVECNHTTGRVIKLSLLAPYTKQINPLLNLSLLHPFEDIRSLNLSVYRMSGFTGLFDDVEGYRSLRRLRNLEILDFSYNQFNNSIFPFLNAATSLKTLILRSNYMDSHFPVKELKDLTNLEYLDLSENGFNGSIPVRGKVFLRQSLILAMILLGHIQGYKSCIVKEREALLELKTYIVSHSRFQNALPTWSKDTESDCCGWEGIKCNRTTGRVIKLSIQPRNLWFKERFLLNLSLLHPFEDVRSLHLSGSGLCKFTGLFDDVEGQIDYGSGWTTWTVL